MRRARLPGGRPRRRLPRLHRRPRHAAARRPRATSPSSSAGCAQAGRVGTVSGRYYAMDRDTRWERVKLAYDAIVHAQGQQRGRARPRRSRPPTSDGETDEFVLPTVIGDYDGVAAGDVAIFVNFRPDRAREMTRALAEPNFDEFRRAGGPTARPDDDDRVPQGLALPGRLPRAAAGDDAGGDDRRGRRPPAARRRDREVRPRHLLLQRRPRGASRRAKSSRLVESPRDVADLRPRSRR